MSWIQAAKVGDKVVTVGGGYNAGNITSDQQVKMGMARPEKGRVYTIKLIHDWGGDNILINFIELDNAHFVGKVGGTIEPGWHYGHFRPVTPRNTDISFAHEILRKVGKPVEVVG